MPQSPNWMQALTALIPMAGAGIAGQGTGLGAFGEQYARGAAVADEMRLREQEMARREAAEAIVTVEDTGSGVPDYALPRIFDRFYSLPRPDTGRKSSGLGLSIVREVARLHGGAATLDNRVGGGARAELWLPLSLRR